MKLSTTGYYLSEPKPWVDWHAGHKFEGVNYYAIKFLDEQEAQLVVVDTTELDSTAFDNSTRCSYHILDSHSLQLVVNPASIYSKELVFTVLSSDVLLDENLKEYKLRQLKTSFPIETVKK